ncbi:MAG: sigma 54-interacting transcriptional regulator, partial [Pseudomonadota bacterium]
SNQVRQVNVRLIGATNVDLPSEVAAGRFRADLLDRLSFEVLTLPPLRARQGDILLLAEHFGRGMAVELGRDFPGFSPRIEKQLKEHGWPGNVRELKNVIERALYRWPEDAGAIDQLIIDPFASPYRLKPSETAEPRSEAAPQPPSSAVNGPFDFKALVNNQEIALLTAALAAAKHNQKAAARYAGLDYAQFRHLAKKYGLI